MTAESCVLLISGIVIIASALIVILAGKRPRYEIFNDQIVINDSLYPCQIPNYAIKSIKLVYILPKVLLRTNGYGGLNMWKGFYRIKDMYGVRRRAALYVENHSKAPYIEIQTTQDLIYMNMKSPELTQQLYDEMIKGVNLLKETELVDCKVLSSKRSVIGFVIFMVIITLISLMPLLFS